MSFINQTNSPAPIVILSGAGELQAAPETSKNFRATLTGAGAITARAARLIRAAAIIAGAGVLTARGRLNNEANVFASAVLSGAAEFAPAANVARGAVAVLSGAGDVTARARLQKSESSELKIFLTVASDYVRPLRAVYGARVAADGLDVPVKSFNYNESAATAGIDANFTLARQLDRARVEAADLFNFDLFDGAEWRALFVGGRRAASDFSFAFSDARASDSAGFSTAAPIAAKLDKSPPFPLTIYDAARVELEAADFETIYDTDGNPFAQQLKPVPDLTIAKLMQIVFVEKCGFAGFKTNLPNWKIRRADFSMTGSFLDGIAGHIGFFNPLFFVVNDIVWILDAASALPAGFAPPLEISADRYKSLRLTQTNDAADGFDLNYSLDENDFDYFFDVTENDALETSGDPFGANYQEIARRRKIRNYYKNAFPNAPVNSNPISETTTTSARSMGGGLQIINIETESYFYNTYQNLKRVEKTIDSLIPDLSRSDFIPFLATVARDVTRHFYRSDLKNARRQILYRSIIEHNGLIAVDSENKTLDRDFKQDLSEDANRAGNLKEGMTTEFGAISATTETIKQSRSGQMKYKVQTVDYLTSPPSVYNATTDARAGDISLNALTAQQKTVKVFRAGALRTAAKMKSLSVAELPLNLAIPFARRKLAARRIRRGTLTLVGFDLSLKRGALLSLLDRDGGAVGNFIVEGFSISGQNLGTKNQVTEQTLQITEIGG